MRSSLNLVLACLLLVACGDEPSDAADGGAPNHTPGVVSYEHDIHALVEKSCVGCHVKGGVAPFELTSWKSVKEHAELMVAAVASQRMPPWPVADDCHSLRDVSTLTDDDRALFEQWQADGFLRGDERDYVAPELEQQIADVDLEQPDLVVMPAESYVAPTNIPDEYRCFLLPGSFDVDTYVTAMDIQPGNESVVHHVQVHTIPEASVAEAQTKDDAEDGPGWTCFGGAGVTGSFNMFSWRPGSEALRLEKSDAALLEQGTHLVIQVHYHPHADQVPAADLTRVKLWTLPEGELPKKIVRRASIISYNLNIPAGDPHYVVEQAWTMRTLSSLGGTSLGGVGSIGGTYVQGEIIGQTPHMHGFGTRLSVTMKRADGDESCMIDVPRWDFEWQMDYLYPPNDMQTYSPDDTLTVRCEYDNSPENQPMIGSTRRDPIGVQWGEGTLDEMCLNYVWIRYPRDAYLAALGK